MNVEWIDRMFDKRRWVVHLLYWFVILLVYAIFFGRRNSNYLQTLFFIALLLPVAISATYFLNYFLLPRYLLPGRYITFGLYFLYTLVGSLFLEVMIALFSFLIMAEMNIRNMSPASIDIFFLFASLLMVVLLGGGIKLLLHWRTSREDLQKLRREKVETELKLLKTQLNPHFLFNTLNNLYYLTTQKSDRAPAAILQLSEILDYVMNHNQSVRVSFQEELKQMHNYIALEKLRYEDRVEITEQIDGPIEAFRVPHMLLITLIENAFKHGVMPSSSKSFISIDILAEQSLSIQIENSSSHQSRDGGIGLENLRHQLQLLYPGRHQLSIDSLPEKFRIRLTLW